MRLSGRKNTKLVLLACGLGWLSMAWLPALSVSQQIDPVPRCECCENRFSQRTHDREKYWRRLRDRISQNSENDDPGAASPAGPNSGQVVFLDFDSGEDGNLIYTPTIRDAIQTEMERIYDRFNVSFTQTIPNGLFSTIVFNEGGLGGAAEDIDFRNLNRSDNAVLNLDGAPGLSGDGLVFASANVAAHELGHLMGLYHQDVFGPVGTGITGGFSAFLTPTYTGPQDAFTESQDHIMVTGGLGFSFFETLTPSWFSERSSIKLMLAEFGSTTIDQDGNDSFATAQPVAWQTRSVPNTIVKGQNAGVGDFLVSTLVVEGSLNSMADGQDFFRIDGRAGDIVNLAVLSNFTDRLSVDPIDPNLTVLDANGNFIDYYGSIAFNEDDIESLDSIMIDLILPADGQYIIKVDSSLDTDAGLYELLAYRIDGTGMLGDINCDGTIDLLDINPLVDVILSGQFLAKADINGDGSVNLNDVGPFVALLVSQ